MKRPFLAIALIFIVATLSFARLKDRIVVVDSAPTSDDCTVATAPVQFVKADPGDLYCCIDTDTDGDGDWTICNEAATISEALVLFLASSEGTCSVNERGTIKVIAGGSGVADSVIVCMKDDLDAYAWFQIN